MKLFSQSVLLQALVILLVLIVLWIPALSSPAFMPSASSDAPLYGLLQSWLQPYPIAASIVAMVLVLAEGIVLNIMFVNAGMTVQNSMLPTLLYVIAMSASSTTLTPMILAAIPIIVCLRQLMLQGTLLTISTNRVCTATAMIGIASMFWLPSALLLLTYLLVAVNYRLYTWRDWMTMLLGLLAPYLLLSVILMFTGGLFEWFQSIGDTLLNPHGTTCSFTTLQAIGNALLILVLLAGVVSVWNLSGERTVLWQKNATTALTFIFGGVAMMFYYCFFPVDMQLMAIPFSFCVATLLMPYSAISKRKKRKSWISATILILTIAAAIIC